MAIRIILVSSEFLFLMMLPFAEPSDEKFGKFYSDNPKILNRTSFLDIELEYPQRLNRIVMNGSSNVRIIISLISIQHE